MYKYKEKNMNLKGNGKDTGGLGVRRRYRNDVTQDSCIKFLKMQNKFLKIQHKNMQKKEPVFFKARPNISYLKEQEILIAYSKPKSWKKNLFASLFLC